MSKIDTLSPCSFRNQQFVVIPHFNISVFINRNSTVLYRFNLHEKIESKNQISVFLRYYSSIFFSLFSLCSFLLISFPFLSFHFFLFFSFHSISFYFYSILLFSSHLFSSFLFSSHLFSSLHFTSLLFSSLLFSSLLIFFLLFSCLPCSLFLFYLRYFVLYRSIDQKMFQYVTAFVYSEN